MQYCSDANSPAETYTPPQNLLFDIYILRSSGIDDLLEQLHRVRLLKSLRGCIVV